MTRKRPEWDRNYSLNGDNRRKRRRKTSFRNRDRVRIEHIRFKRYAGDRERQRNREISIIQSNRTPHFEVSKKTSKLVEWKARFNPGEWLIVLTADKTRRGSWIQHAHLFFRKNCGQYRVITKRIHRLKTELLLKEELDQIDEFACDHEPVVVGRPF